MGDLIYRLLTFINRSKDDTINYTIATTMLSNLKEIPHMNINKLADICYTSPAAISRFCRKLGYSNLAEFKGNLSTSLVSYKNGFLKPKGLQSYSSREEILNSMLVDVKSEIDTCMSNIDLIEIDNLVNLIHQKNRVVFFGTQFSQLMAQDFQLSLATTSKISDVAIDVLDQEKLAESLTSDCLAILISPTGRFIHYHERLWNKIKESNATVFIITENTGNKYKDRADHILYYGSCNEDYAFCSATKYSLTFLLEYIFTRYCHLYWKN